jgi:hypothetical protein
MAGESNKVDKHDKEKEVKRGALDTDTFNGMKKATLKEEVEESIFDTPRMGGFHNSKGVAGHVPNTHKQDKEYADSNRRANKEDDDKTEMSEDAKKNLLGKVVGALRTKYPDITAGIIKDFIKTHYQDLLDGADIEDEFREYISVNYESPSDFMNEDTDYSVELLVPSVAYNVESGELADSPYTFATEDEIESGEADITTYTDGGELDAWVFDNSYKQAIDFAKRYPDLIKINSGSSVTEKKGKDHDGDGDIDDKDYMAAKDKAIKKAMGKDPKEEQLKEAIKSIIKKTLNEDVLNEAATKRLADWGEGYESFEGVKSVVNDLENVVTEVEAFYDKIGDKIAKIFERTAEFKNGEGLKIGAFIAPSLETSFLQDIRPVTKKGFLNKIQLPKVRTISQADVDAHNSGEKPLGETEIVEEPKSTVFTPNF